MKLTKILFIIFLFLPSTSFAIPYIEFIEKISEQSLSIKSAQYSLDAAKERKKSGDYFFIPSLTLSPTYKYEVEKNTNTDTKEIKAQITSNIYSSDIFDRMKERKTIVSDAEILIEIEKEKLKIIILKNLLSISYYEELYEFAKALNQKITDINQQVKNQFEAGISSENNLNRTNLLLSKIEAEINGIEKQLLLFKSNITAIANIEYPKEGIHFKNDEIKHIKNFIFDINAITNNLEYRSLQYKYNIAKYLASQQDPLLNLSLSIDNNWTYNESIDDFSDEPKFQISGKINLFNHDQYREKKALFKEVDIAKTKMNIKLVEIRNNVDNFLLLQIFFLGEISNLTGQIDQIEKLITGYANEYEAGKVSLYEMLNTHFDLFTTTKQKIDIEIQFSQNKLDLMQANGSLL